jgi:hypothetical protein
MHKSKLPGIAFGALLLLLGFAVWYILKPDPSATSTAPRNAALDTTASTSGSELGQPSADQGPASAKNAPKPLNRPMPLSPERSDEGIPVWERKIDTALRSQGEHSAIALGLLSEVNSMPPEGQTAAAQHIVNLIADKDYLQVIPYIKNNRLDHGFQEIIVAESLNRPDTIKLPVLLAAARAPGHPMAETAVSILTVLLDANHGTDWSKWEQSVKQSLENSEKENAAEKPVQLEVKQ